MTKTANAKLFKQLALALAVGLSLRFVLSRLGWHPRPFVSNTSRFNFDVEWNRIFPCFVLWMIFSVYWTIAARNSAPTRSSESWLSTFLHQFVLGTALLVLLFPVPGLTGWFLPVRFHFLVPVGLAIQAAFLMLAVWARRHLGRNWSAEVRVGEGHELIRTGPYKMLRHPIYTAMLGMFLGTAIASSQYHALLGFAILVLAYMRKTRLEEEILRRTFGNDYDAYRRDTWALVPLLF